MENAIRKNMQSEAVSAAINKLCLKDNELWQLFYDTGADYLDNLEKRLHRKRVFDLMFKRFLSIDGFGAKSFASVMKTIRISPAFWFWWSVQLWSRCNQFEFHTKTELIYHLQFNDALIPHFILKQIFYGKQEPKCRPGTTGIPSCKVATINPASGKVRRGAASKV